MKCDNCGNNLASDDEDGEDFETWGVEKEFVTETSCHGISFWYKSRNMAQRIFWVLLVVGMTCGVVQQITERIINYYEYKTTTSVSREFVGSIEFPAVTICNFNRLFRPSSDTEKAAMQVLNKISTPSDLGYARAINFPINESLLDIYNSSNFSVSGYYDEKGYNFTDGHQLLICVFASQLCTVSNFTPIITSNGKCYTFNVNQSVQHNQTVAGLGNGLMFMINVQHWEYTEEPNYGRQEAGILFQVHRKDVTPNLNRFGIAVPVGRKGYAILSQVDSEVMYKPWGKCDPDSEKDLRFFDKYTLNSCLLECYTEQVIATCGCRHFDQHWAEGFAPECSINQMLNCSSPLLARIESELSPETCNCTIPCSFTEYPVRMSYSYVPIRETSLYYQTTIGLPPDYIGENVLGLEVTFEEIGYTKEVQSKQVDESGLLSDMGGQLGLWIGMSFITICEFIQYFIMRIVFCFKKPKLKRKRSEKKSNHSNGYKGHPDIVRGAWDGKINNGFKL